MPNFGKPKTAMQKYPTLVNLSAKANIATAPQLTGTDIYGVYKLGPTLPHSLLNQCCPIKFQQKINL
jgi:hypothetical protein